MKCVLEQRRNGWCLVEAGTGRFYGYVRANDAKKTAALLEHIKQEIARTGYYEAYSGGKT